MKTKIRRRHSAREVWIGLVEIRPRAGNELLEGALGAFTNALAMAATNLGYTRVVTKEMEAKGFAVISIKGQEPLRRRLETRKLDPMFNELADHVRESGAVIWDQYYSYDSIEEEDPDRLKVQ